MENITSIIGQTFRLKNEITGDIEETMYTVRIIESDNEIPGLYWIYLISEYGDENIEYDPKYDLYYARITNNLEGLLV